jgi:hypothetical protein
MAKKALRAGTLLLLTFALSLRLAHADFSKTIPYDPGVQINAVTTWYFANCTTSLGEGSYSITVAPAHGALSFADLSGPVPGCPQGSPSLPATAAYYTWTDTTTTDVTDAFQLDYVLNGQVLEVIDITVAGLPLSISPASLPDTTSGDPYSVQFLASNAHGTVSWSITGGSLPAGFTLNSQGLLSSTGSPAAVPAPSTAMSGPYSFTVEAYDGVTTAKQPLTLTVLTADCSQKLDIVTKDITVLTNPSLRSSVVSYPEGDYLELDTDVGLLFFPFAPQGISINASGAISQKAGVSVYENPNLVYIQDLFEWSGSGTYGKGSQARDEYEARVGMTDTAGQPLAVSLPLLDTTFYPNTTTPRVKTPVTFVPFVDSPNVKVRIVDNRNELLSKLSYFKAFTNYIGCYFDSDNKFHTLATVDWNVTYSGTVTVPFGTQRTQFTTFLQDTTQAVVAGTPQMSSQLPVVSGPIANCHITFQRFDGTIPTAYCAP